MKTKQGISLIVLIITIIVLILISAAIILGFKDSELVFNAQKATFQADISSFKDELSIFISKDYLIKQGNRKEKINTTTYTKDGSKDSIYTYIPSFKSKYDSKFRILNDKLVGTSELSKEESKWTENVDVEVLDGVLAGEIDTSYYGKEVSNYNSKVNVIWRVFYADDNNIYLIAKDYIDSNLLPFKEGVRPTSNYSSTTLSSFDDIIAGKYNGSSDITNEKLKALNNEYFNVKKYSSTENSMKLIAYMLDSEIWTEQFKDSANKVDYVIGGPTISLFLNSYNKYYAVQCKSKVYNESGYTVSSDGTNWGYCMIPLANSLYNISSNNDTMGMRLASTSSTTNHVLTTSGIINAFIYNSPNFGYRPVVCLKSNVRLKITGENTVELR